MNSNGLRSLRLLSQIWAVFYLVFVVMNFISQNAYAYLVSPMSALYIGILGIYAGSKEFDRWQKQHTSRRHGEAFVIIFSLIMGILFVAAIVLGPAYHIPSDIVATYIGVITIFALTQKSKEEFAERKKR